MDTLFLALKSVRNRWLTAFLTAFTIAVSVLLLLSVEKIRHTTKDSFANTISGTDLIVGARSGSIQLLLYSVFRMGNATNNISWKSFEEIKASKNVKWAVPISLGDSHRGFRVMGTSLNYFEHYRVGRKKKLELATGKLWPDLFGAVIGSNVAKKLGYKVGDNIVISHGLGRASLVKHDDMPFFIAGILKPTGTPVDQTVHVSLEAIEAIHIDWKFGGRIPGLKTSPEEVRKKNLQPEQITAALIGLKSRLSVFSMQRAINNYRAEPLLAILPGATLQELWGMMGSVETALLIISWCVVIAGLLGLLAMLIASLNERRREIAILRSVGSRPSQIMTLLVAESGVLTLLGILTGVIFFTISLMFLKPWLLSQYGMDIGSPLPGWPEIKVMGLILVAGILAGLIPAALAYQNSLADGMMIKS